MLKKKGVLVNESKLRIINFDGFIYSFALMSSLFFLYAKKGSLADATYLQEFSDDVMT